jgi:hypothetical protein
MIFGTNEKGGIRAGIIVNSFIFNQLYFNLLMCIKLECYSILFVITQYHLMSSEFWVFFSQIFYNGIYVSPVGLGMVEFID